MTEPTTPADTKSLAAIDPGTPWVTAHLATMQSVVSRMAGNSAASKAWCVTLVSAVLVLVADKGKPEVAWVAAIPAALFLFLDTYYLSLEKGFRNSYEAFVKKLHDGTLEKKDAFRISPEGCWCRNVWWALKSASVLPFYLSLGALVCAAYFTVLSRPGQVQGAPQAASAQPAAATTPPSSQAAGNQQQAATPDPRPPPPQAGP